MLVQVLHRRPGGFYEEPRFLFVASFSSSYFHRGLPIGECVINVNIKTARRDYFFCYLRNAKGSAGKERKGKGGKNKYN